MRYIQANGIEFIRHIYDTNPTLWDEDHCCLARHLTDEEKELFGISELKIVTPPYFHPGRQRRDEVNAILIDGAWMQNYVVTDLDETEISENFADRWNVVRAERNAKILQCDWTQVPDAALTNTQTASWASYRQALRDITMQSDPFNIEWPASPGA